MTELGRKSTEAINAILKNHGIAEVKIERNRVVVVEISRKVKYKDEDGSVGFPEVAPDMNDSIATMKPDFNDSITAMKFQVTC